MSIEQTVPATRRKARRGEGTKTREEILDAAERLMLATGDVEAVSMRAIAGKVGVTPPAIYAHFTDKDDLFQGLCDRRFGQLNQIFQEAIGTGGDPLERLMSCGLAYIRFGIDNPEAYRFLMMTKNEDDFALTITNEAPSQGDMAFMTLVGLVTACIEEGEIRQMDPLDASLLIWSMVHGLTSLMITSPKFAWSSDIVDKLMEAAMIGMAPR